MRPSISSMFTSFFDLSKGRVSNNLLRKRIEDDAAIDGIHLCQLIAAMLISSIGLNLDSTEAVIGAMLICPLMGSVIALAYGVSTMDRQMMRESLVGLSLQFGVCLLTSTLYFVISPISTTTSQLLSNSNATIWTVIIAFVGGFAGSIGLSRRLEPSTLIAGVAVATSLMPPLCSIGFGLSLRDMAIAVAAFYDFLVNVVFIAFGATIVFVWLRVPLITDLDGDGVVTPEEQARAERLSRSLRRKLIIGLTIFAIPCFFFSVRTVRITMKENGTVFEVNDAYETKIVTKELELICPQLVHYRVGVEDSYDTKEEVFSQRIIATVETSVELSPTAKKEAEALIRIHISDLDTVSFVVVGPQTTTGTSAAPDPSDASTSATDSAAVDSPASSTSDASTSSTSATSSTG